MFTVTVNVPAETFAALCGVFSNLDSEDGPLDAVGKFVTSNGMFRVFASHGEGTWEDVLRGGDPLDATGALKGGFVYAMGPDGRSVIVTNEGREKMIQAVQNFGATIRAVNVPHLTFRIGDQWVSKKQVTIPARLIFVWFSMLRDFVVEVAKTNILENAQKVLA